MKKGLLILGNKKYEEEIDVYDTFDDGDRIALKFAPIKGSWCHPGKLGYSLIDTGNFFVFKDHLLNKVIQFDYCQAEVLRALLKLEDRNGERTFDHYTKGGK